MNVTACTAIDLTGVIVMRATATMAAGAASARSATIAGKRSKRDYGAAFLALARNLETSDATRSHAARTRLKKVATFASRSLARADSRAVQLVISPTAATPRVTASSTELISVDARAVCPAAV